MLSDLQINAIEKRVLETPEGHPLPDFDRAPVLALIEDLRLLRARVAALEAPKKPQCRCVWRAGVLFPPDSTEVRIPDGTRCVLEPHGEDTPHDFKGVRKEAR